ncbi:MAG: membrane protein insertase YidC [Bacteroidales bacterium]|jgi:YidC/Oxa1 family membrane protein insertase|nr:membrane protein insertase YidC [Bacteroidales bacterium]
MDKNTIIGLLLIVALLIGYSIWNSPSKEEKEAQQRAKDSLQRETIAKQVEDSLAKLQTEIMDTVKAEKQNKKQETVDNQTVAKNQFGSFATSASQQNVAPILVENDLYRLQINPKGAQIERVELKNVKTWDKQPLVLLNPEDDHKFGFSFYTDYLSLHTSDLHFSLVNDIAEGDTLSVQGADSLQVVLRLYPNLEDGSLDTAAYIEYVYIVRGDDYRTALKINFVNTSQYLNRNQHEYELTWLTTLHQQEKNRKTEMQATNIYYSDIEDVENLKESADAGDSVSYTTRVKWVSFKQMFFTSTLIADNYFDNGTFVTAMPKGNKTADCLKDLKARLTLSITENQPSFGLNFYFGPNKYNLLKKYDIGLENQIFLGRSIIAWINKFAIIPIFNFFEGFGWHYGLIILILTIIIKLVLFPLTAKSYKSSARMRVVKPQVDEISKRYPKQEDAMKKQQAIMGLYRQLGIKPMGGCLPMLLQFPILVAMFRFFPAAYELRQQSFLWADDLSTYDAIVSWNQHIPIISSFYGNHISLFTLLMTIATLFYTILNNKMMSAGGNEQQMKIMKWMMYLMPIMFLGIFNNYAAGLSYYYLLVNLITFVQMGVFRLTINEDKLRRQMETYKAKPVKKSKWQERMDKMMKAQQERAKANASANSRNALPPTKQRSNTSLQNKKKR